MNPATMNPEDTPALMPPPGVTPNFIDPPSIMGPFAAAHGIMTFVATVGFMSRAFTRHYIIKKLQLEDFCFFLGWVSGASYEAPCSHDQAFFVGFQSVWLSIYPSIVGRHQWDVNLIQIAHFLQYLNYTSILYGFSLLFIKVAILLQLKGIFKGTKRDSTYWLTISLIALNTCYYIPATISQITACLPREKIWNPEIPGTCLNYDALAVSSAAFNLVLDVLIFICPIYAILRLRIRIKRKLGITAIFATGFLVVVASILRLYYSIQLTSFTDVTYSVVNFAWTACLEAACAILIAVFPVMPRLYQYFRGTRDETASSRYNAAYRYSPGSGSNSRGLKPSVDSRGTTLGYEKMGSDTHLQSDWTQLRSLAAPRPAYRPNIGGNFDDRDIVRTVDIETRFEDGDQGRNLGKKVDGF